MNDQWTIEEVYYYENDELVYDDNGQIIAIIASLWDETLKEWRPSEKYCIFYSNHLLSDIQTLPIADAGFNPAIYPNPAHEFVNVKTDGANEATAILFSNSGKALKTVTSNNSLIAIPLDGLPGGLYIIRIQYGQNIYTQKLIIN